MDNLTLISSITALSADGPLVGPSDFFAVAAELKRLERIIEDRSRQHIAALDLRAGDSVMTLDGRTVTILYFYPFNPAQARMEMAWGQPSTLYTLLITRNLTRPLVVYPDLPPVPITALLPALCVPPITGPERAVLEQADRLQRTLGGYHPMRQVAASLLQSLINKVLLTKHGGMHYYILTPRGHAALKLPLDPAQRKSYNAVVGNLGPARQKRKAGPKGGIPLSMLEKKRKHMNRYNPKSVHRSGDGNITLARKIASKLFVAGKWDGESPLRVHNPAAILKHAYPLTSDKLTLEQREDELYVYLPDAPPPSAEKPSPPEKQVRWLKLPPGSIQYLGAGSHEDAQIIANALHRDGLWDGNLPLLIHQPARILKEANSVLVIAGELCQVYPYADFLQSTHMNGYNALVWERNGRMAWRVSVYEDGQSHRTIIDGGTEPPSKNKNRSPRRIYRGGRWKSVGGQS